MHRFYYFVVLLLFISCGKENATVNKTIIFNTGFNITNRFSGAYYDKNANKKLIFFADPVSRKKLKVFNDSGQLIKDVSLKNAVNFLHNIGGISVVSSDTIILNSAYTNKLAFINSKGELWKKMDLGRYLDNKRGDVYELYSSPSDFLLKDELFFFCEWRDNVLRKKSEDYNFNVFSEFHHNNFSGPYFFKVSDIYSNELTAEFGLDSFYSNLSTKSVIYLEPPHYTIVNGDLFIISVYSDKLYLVDKENLKLKKEIEISSEYTSIGTTPFPIDNNTYTNIEALNKQKALESGYIARLHFDAVKKIYYALVFTSDKGANPKDVKSWPFSIMTLDENFKKVDEIMMTDVDVMGAFSIMTDKGLMFYSNKNSNDAKSSTKEFVIYNL